MYINRELLMLFRKGLVCNVQYLRTDGNIQGEKFILRIFDPI